MELSNRARAAGIAGIVGGLLFTVSTIMEHTLNLINPGPALYMPNQTMFLIAQVGWVVGILALFWAGAVGSGWFGRISLGLFLLAETLLVIAQVVKMFTGNGDFILFPIGGLLAFPTSLLAGIAVVTAKRMAGWQRYMLLLYALYTVLALLVPLVVANQDPTMLSEGFWGALWAMVGVALLTSQQVQPGRFAASIKPGV